MKKINWHILRVFSLWMAIAVYFVVSLTFVGNRKAKIICKDIQVNILDSVKNSFVTEADVINLLEKSNKRILGYGVTAINTLELEKILRKHPPIKGIEIYTNADGYLLVDITQREPIVRVVSSVGPDFYIDKDGKLMPLQPRYASHVLVASGNVEIDILVPNGKSVLTDIDTTAFAAHLLKSIYLLSEHISSNIFLESQIQQIYVNDDYEFEMIPRVGNHLVLFGDISNYQYKFEKLCAIYLKGFNSIGWNNYSVINLKYSNQVICTKPNVYE